MWPRGMFQELKEPPGQRVSGSGRVAMGKETVSYDPNMDTLKKKVGAINNQLGQLVSPSTHPGDLAM